jgi:hypothetical protein
MWQPPESVGWIGFISSSLLGGLLLLVIIENWFQPPHAQ